MKDRSNLAEVRNPLLALPAAAKIQALPQPMKEALRQLLLELRADAQEKAEKAWRTHKAPMALYWKCVSVYTGHLAKILRKPQLQLVDPRQLDLVEDYDAAA